MVMVVATKKEYMLYALSEGKTNTLRARSCELTNTNIMVTCAYPGTRTQGTSHRRIAAELRAGSLHQEEASGLQ